jgi:hypothetical protein
VILKNNLPSKLSGPVGLIPEHSTPNGNKVITSQSFLVVNTASLDGVGVTVGVCVEVGDIVGVGVLDAVFVGVTVGVGVVVGVGQTVDAGTFNILTPALGKT